MSEDRHGLLIGDQRIGASEYLMSVGGRVLSNVWVVDVEVHGRRVSLHLTLVSDFADYFLHTDRLPELAVFAYDAGNRQSFVNLARHFAQCQSSLALRDASDLPLLLLVTRPGDAVSAAEACRFAQEHLDMLSSGGLQAVVERLLAPPFFSGRLTLPISATSRYRITSGSKAALALDIAGGRVVASDACGSPSQQFVVQQTIVSATSGLALTADKAGRIVQSPDMGRPAQRWEWHREDGTIRSADGKTALETSDTPKAKEVWARPISGQSLQRWALQPIPDGPP